MRSKSKYKVYSIRRHRWKPTDTDTLHTIIRNAVIDLMIRPHVNIDLPGDLLVDVGLLEKNEDNTIGFYPNPDLHHLITTDAATLLSRYYRRKNQDVIVQFRTQSTQPGMLSRRSMRCRLSGNSIETHRFAFMYIAQEATQPNSRLKTNVHLGIDGQFTSSKWTYRIESMTPYVIERSEIKRSRAHRAAKP